MPKPVYLILDPDSTPEAPGYAMDNPIEGWCFTILRSAAKEFASFKEARAAADQHYNPGRKTRVLIVAAEPLTQPK